MTTARIVSMLGLSGKTHMVRLDRVEPVLPRHGKSRRRSNFAEPPGCLDSPDALPILIGRCLPPSVGESGSTISGPEGNNHAHHRRRHRSRCRTHDLPMTRRHDARPTSHHTALPNPCPDSAERHPATHVCAGHNTPRRRRTIPLRRRCSEHRFRRGRTSWILAWTASRTPRVGRRFGHRSRPVRVADRVAAGSHIQNQTTWPASMMISPSLVAMSMALASSLVASEIVGRRSLRLAYPPW
jgi:hypothetical protein